MENHPINRADITVVPYFNTNEDLAQAICDKLNSYLERTSIIEHQPLTAHGPKFLVYRPSGRAGDEFKEHVSRHLMNQTGVKTYLIIASSTKPADQFSISKDDQDKLQDEQTKLVIDEGRLVDKNESYYDSNRTELWKLAEDICQKYKNIQMRCCIYEPDSSGFGSYYICQCCPCIPCFSYVCRCRCCCRCSKNTD